MSVHTLSARSSMDSLRSTSSVTASSVASAPDTLPPAVAGPSAWEGKELNPSKYVTEFTDRDNAEIHVVLATLNAMNKDGEGIRFEDISKDNFQLSPELAAKLAAVSKRLHEQQGVEVLRGLDKLYVNDHQAIQRFVGLMCYVAPLRATDAFANQTLSHVRDATKDPVPKGAEGLGLAGSKITVEMDFHADRFSGDVLALHVRHDGGENDGGEQFVASAHRIYNELLATEPEVLETMAEPNWPFEVKKNHHDVPTLQLGPVLFFSGNKPMFQIVKAPLVGTPLLPRHHTMPDLTKTQYHALERVNELAKRFAAPLDRKVGDIQLIHNLSVLHARSKYGLSSNGEVSKRHLYRMFLRDPENAWKKPEICREQFDDPFTPGRQQEIPSRDTDAYQKISGMESHG